MIKDKSPETRELIMQVVNKLIPKDYLGRNYYHRGVFITTNERLLHLLFSMIGDERSEVKLSFIVQIHKKYEWCNREDLYPLRNCLSNTRYNTTIGRLRSPKILYLTIHNLKTKFTKDVEQTATNIDQEFTLVSEKLQRYLEFFSPMYPLSMYPLGNSIQLKQ